MTETALAFPLTMKFLQQWRLIHAMSEGPCPVSIAPQFQAGIEYLQKYFKADIQTTGGKPVRSGFVHIDTLGPSTRIGPVTRPLIFPHEIVDYCRSLWVEERRLKFGFIGLSHWGRIATLGKWHEQQFGAPLVHQNLATTDDLSQSVEKAMAKPEGSRCFVAFSKRGRAFPMKVWDNDYYLFLSRMLFSLCPDGDQIWSYRFFESLLCGSIPVVQTVLPIYDGFRFYTLSDSPENYVWREEDALYNFNLCRERLTLSADEWKKVFDTAA